MKEILSLRGAADSVEEEIVAPGEVAKPEVADDDKPIKRDEIFDPYVEKNRIRHLPPGDERKLELKKYKEKLNYQTEGLAKMQEDLISVIRLNPDAPIDNLLRRVNPFARKYGFSFEQMDEAQGILIEYSKRHEVIKEYRTKFPKDEDLFEELFKAKPEGKIEVVIGPLTMHFKCYDPKDYERLYSSVSSPGLDGTQAVLSTGGVHLRGLPIPGLENAVTAENVSLNHDWYSRTVLDHEEQHAITSLFTEKGADELHFKIEPDLSNGELRLALLDQFRPARLTYDEWAKDEIIASFADNYRGEKDILGALIKSKEEGGLYDYTFELRDYLYNKLPNIFLEQGAIKENQKVIIREMMEKVFIHEYQDMLSKGLEAIFSLEQKGYSIQQAVALLINQPLPKWPRTVARLLKAKQAETP